MADHGVVRGFIAEEAKGPYREKGAEGVGVGGGVLALLGDGWHLGERRPGMHYRRGG